MGQVRWAGWTMAIATALVISGAQVARADVASDKPAAIVVYPKIEVNSGYGLDTVIRLANTNTKSPISVHCFYIDANSHCTNDGQICGHDGHPLDDLSPTLCSGGGTCAPGWVETDFNIVLTYGQPIEWKASDGLANSSLPLPYGVCTGNQFYPCGTNATCALFGWGTCTASNIGTRIPPVAEDPFVGELKCIAVNNTSEVVPIASNYLKGEAKIEYAYGTGLDVASYNAIGLQATNADGHLIGDNPLVLGPGSDGNYNGCPNVLILDNFFDWGSDPISGDVVLTDLTLVPCSEDFLRQVGGSATVQYLIYNEFEQRLSTSKPVKCFYESLLSLIDTTQPLRSIFSAGMQGTLTGQTRLTAVSNPSAELPSGLLGVPIELHVGPPYSTAAFNLHYAGARDVPDYITLP
jgi:hypothetical protein